MKFKNTLIALVLIIILGISGFCFYLRPKYVVPILMYHHIDDKGRSSSLSVSPENFRRQMHFLAEGNYNVISLAELLQAKIKKERLAKNTVVITFDDGYEDNYIFGFPVLKEYNLPAIIFVIADSAGEETYLDYAQIKEMTASGIIDIGSHTLSGAYLPGRTSEEIKAEICASKIKLQSRLNKKVDFLCYPIGGFSPGIQKIAADCGYKAACATNRGRSQTYLNDDLFALKRIKVKDSANIFVFRAKLSGYYNFFRRVREPF